MGKSEIETKRLHLRRWRGDDLVPDAALCADPQVMHWIGNGSLKTKQECAAAIKAFQQMWNKHGFGLFAVELVDTSEFLGFTGLSIPAFLPEIMPAVEIGWRLKRSTWGKGIATEAAQAALKFGFEDRGLDRIISIYQVGNDTSGRIMQKLGMTLERQTTDPSCQRPVLVYEAKS